jgi:hypothetical protein
MAFLRLSGLLYGLLAAQMVSQVFAFSPLSVAVLRGPCQKGVCISSRAQQWRSKNRVGLSMMAASSQLEQLAAMTVLSVDTGDLNVIEDLAKTGFITDATTNPRESGSHHTHVQ